MFLVNASAPLYYTGNSACISVICQSVVAVLCANMNLLELVTNCLLQWML